MQEWISNIDNILRKQNNKILDIDIEKRTIAYPEKIKTSRKIKSITGDEEIVRAFLVNHLINNLDYKVENIELEKEYVIKGGHEKLNPRIDLIVKDSDGNPFFFIEVKAPDKFEKDKSEIEGQLFSLAQAEERDFKKKVRYLVYYTVELSGEDIVDRAIIIDFEKYKTYVEWEKDGFVSVSNELTAGYGKPKKAPLTKGDEKYDLRVRIDRKDIEGLGRNLHDVLWGGGGINDSEIFYSLVNIILAKIQDEYEKEDGEEYDFQVYQYGDYIEGTNRIYERVNALYKRALREQLNVTEQQRIDDDNIINRNKFSLNKLVYTVQALETFSFLEGRSSLDGKDILGDFFENITREGFKQNKGQFFTPTNIVKFIIYALGVDKLAIDKLNTNRELPLIIDPSAGSGTYLVEAMKVITKEIKYKQKNKIKSSRQIKQRFEELFMPDYNENKWARNYLYGCEINFDLGTASKVNMILHGDGSTNIFVKDGLLPFSSYIKEESPNYLETCSVDPLYGDKEVNGKFDVIISNPPFNVDLDKHTQRDIKNIFLFGDKNNSENLFIERYYQLLKEEGRLGVVLPESVFDTTENKYIRLFLFKYFNIKAVISLPKLTFEPFTSTKTSILLAQKKTKNEVEKWNEYWHQYGKEWGLLKTRVEDYYKYFVDGKKLNKKWAKDVVKDIEENNIDNIKKNIRRYLKDFYNDEDQKLEIKEVLEKYKEEIDSLSMLEKETDVFGFYNAWWVFGEVTKEMNYDIIIADADNVGYKRTKRGEIITQNDLFDLEYAPTTLNINEIIEDYSLNINELKEQIELLKSEKSVIESQKTKSATAEKKIEKFKMNIEDLEEKINELNDEKMNVEEVLDEYYSKGTLKEEYMDRTDEQLISYFKNGVLSRFKSEDVLLRENESKTILDMVRQEILWK